MTDVMSRHHSVVSHTHIINYRPTARITAAYISSLSSSTQQFTYASSDQLSFLQHLQFPPKCITSTLCSHYRGFTAVFPLTTCASSCLIGVDTCMCMQIQDNRSIDYQQMSGQTVCTATSSLTAAGYCWQIALLDHTLTHTSDALAGGSRVQ